MRRTALLAAGLICACVSQSEDGQGAARLSTFSVVVHGANTPGTPIGLPQTFRGYQHTVAIDVEARDSSGLLYPLDGTVRLSAAPADVSGDTRVDLSEGQAMDVQVELLQPYGRTSIWVTDSVREGATQVFGASAPLHFDNPTLAQLQETSNAWNSPLECRGDEGEACHYVTIDRGTLIVTNVAGDGFNVTDVVDDCRSGEAEDRCFNHLYVFAYSYPEGVERGQCLCSVSGIVSEYIGFTELSFPEWDGSGDCDACRAVAAVPPEERIPEPVVLDAADVRTSLRMESLEAALVRVHEARVRPTDATFEEYGQWKIGLPDGASLNVVTEATVPLFDPRNETGTVLASMTGTLKDIGPARPRWILVPRDPDDIVRQ